MERWGRACQASCQRLMKVSPFTSMTPIPIPFLFDLGCIAHLEQDVAGLEVLAFAVRCLHEPDHAEKREPLEAGCAVWGRVLIL